MRKEFRWILLTLILLVSLSGVSWANPMVRVGIINGKDAVVISGQRSFQVVNLTSGRVIANGKAEEKCRIEYTGGSLYLNRQFVSSPLLFRLLPGNDNEYLMIDGRRYRGEVEVRVSVTKRGITVIEKLPVEEYIYGIIPWEISPAWPVEAVKAQAVAARTYALYHLGKHAKDGFDLCNTTDCQVYGGRESEDPRGNWAVDATRGMVVTYKNKLIPTFFYSSGGGYSENSENVWSDRYEYLRAVPDFDQDSPYYQWQTRFTVAEITRGLQEAGYNIGKLQGIRLSPLHTGINNASDRGISGRIKTMDFIGSERSLTLQGNDVRRIFKLNSTMFDINLPDNQNAVMAGSAVNTVVAASAVNVKSTGKTKKRQKKENTTKKQTPAVPETVKAPSSQASAGAGAGALRTEAGVYILSDLASTAVVTFTGRGSGHGVGLSQWGSKAMAEKASQNDHTYYQQILKHYYQGVDVSKWY